MPDFPSYLQICSLRINLLMNRVIVLTTFIVLLAGCISRKSSSGDTGTGQTAVAFPTDKGYSNSFAFIRSPAVENAAHTRQEKILEEIKQLGKHDWAGVYSSGNGTSENTSFMIAPHTGYVFEGHGCGGLYERNYGTVTQTATGRIRLSFTLPHDDLPAHGIPPEFIPVSWGSRHYLISPNEMIEFCNSVNAGSGRRKFPFGSHLLRQGDEKLEVVGLPKIPSEFQELLLVKPIEATITSVGPNKLQPRSDDLKIKYTSVTINAGRNKGVRPGMELYEIRNQSWDPIRIIKTEANHSEGVMTQIGEKEPGPQSGWRLSTRAPWNIDKNGEH